MILGFTGTRKGLTLKQWQTLELAAKILPPIHLAVHGDCVGADAAFHELMQGRSIPIRTRPCDVVSMRNHCRDPQEVMPVKSPLDRNIDIVADCTLLLACPGQMFEERRSGTWHTIRTATKVGKAVMIVWPDGTIEHRNAPESFSEPEP